MRNHTLEEYVNNMTIWIMRARIDKSVEIPPVIFKRDILTWEEEQKMDILSDKQLLMKLTDLQTMWKCDGVLLGRQFHPWAEKGLPIHMLKVINSKGFNIAVRCIPSIKTLVYPQDEQQYERNKQILLTL